MHPFLRGGGLQMLPQLVAAEKKALFHMEPQPGGLRRQAGEAQIALGKRQDLRPQRQGVLVRDGKKAITLPPQPACGKEALGGAIDRRLAQAPARGQLAFGGQSVAWRGDGQGEELAIVQEGEFDRAVARGGRCHGAGGAITCGMIVR